MNISARHRFVICSLVVFAITLSACGGAAGPNPKPPPTSKTKTETVKPPLHSAKLLGNAWQECTGTIDIEDAQKVFDAAIPDLQNCYAPMMFKKRINKAKVDLTLHVTKDGSVDDVIIDSTMPKNKGDYCAKARARAFRFSELESGQCVVFTRPLNMAIAFQTITDSEEQSEGPEIAKKTENDKSLSPAKNGKPETIESEEKEDKGKEPKEPDTMLPAKAPKAVKKPEKSKKNSDKTTLSRATLQDNP